MLGPDSNLVWLAGLFTASAGSRPKPLRLKLCPRCALNHSDLKPDGGGKATQEEKRARAFVQVPELAARGRRYVGQQHVVGIAAQADCIDANDLAAYQTYVAISLAGEPVVRGVRC